ncbi:glycosyltransferase family 2 protein [Vibrio cincinnatiensis]|uniref:glycosyltransferase family 2 protein n=1 Tax=Vibrio cincinnatiensis TaxID=675 RepID=UPI001302B4F1|nr:glycosyltransferase [Vibrio cincinnatiensis]
MEISIVVIGLNESKNLDRCFCSIYSLMKNSRDITEFELIYVDSGSVDSTFDVLRNYPDIRCFMLKGVKSAAAARKVGELQSKFDYLLFLDGDMEVDSSFLNRLYTSQLLEKDDFAGVIGFRREMLVFDNEAGYIEQSSNYYSQRGISKLSHIGGALFIKKSALLACGGFDPYMKMWEEQDLLVRINAKSKNIYGINIPFITHYNRNRSTVVNSIKSYLSFYGTGYYFSRYFWKSLLGGCTIPLIKNQLGILLLVVFLITTTVFFSKYSLIFLGFIFMNIGLKGIVHSMIRLAWVLFYIPLSMLSSNKAKDFEYESF